MTEQRNQIFIHDHQIPSSLSGTDQPDSELVESDDAIHDHFQLVDPATPTKEMYPNEYLSFRLGRLMVQLPIVIEQAYLTDSCPLCNVYANHSEPPHVRDQFCSLDRVWADLEATLEQLDANAPSISKQVVREASAALSEVTRQVSAGLRNGDAANLSKLYGELRDITREYSYEKFADDPLNRALAIFRGEDAPDEDAPDEDASANQLRKVNGIESPLNCESWDRFKKRIHELVSRLGELSAFFDIGRSLEQLCEVYLIKESVEFVGKSWSQLYRKLNSEAAEQISRLANLGVTTPDFVWTPASELDFETSLRTTVLQIEERLKSLGEKNGQTTPLAPETGSPTQFSDHATIAPEGPAVVAGDAGLQTPDPAHSDPEENTESDLIFANPTIDQPLEAARLTEQVKMDRAKLASSQQRALFDWMVTVKTSGTFDQLRKIENGWRNGWKTSDDGVEKKLKEMRARLPASRWYYEISISNHEFTWKMFNGSKLD